MTDSIQRRIRGVSSKIQKRSSLPWRPRCEKEVLRVNGTELGLINSFNAYEIHGGEHVCAICSTHTENITILHLPPLHRPYVSLCSECAKKNEGTQ